MAREPTAILGPTNTGKTHHAIERMCMHTSGVIGFPLRLLAREAYDRVVRIKGRAQVALLTGEERIVPEGARYFLCTAESMPATQAFDFVALDEAQMATDPGRGHVFTNHLLHTRGTSETLLLGAETLGPILSRLLPGFHVTTRPRLSKLSVAAPAKLSRLPKRTAIIAFTSEEVYRIAELIRRHRGGAAIVMGSLSPKTRNAQVALYQSGEVDYLVATDAIGMGLNLDIDHVAFAALSKFDGHRKRRLTPAEMAQIAGRAGRHRRDGHFSTIASEDPGHTLSAEEVEAIESHVFRPAKRLVWRNFRLDYSSLAQLTRSLETEPGMHGLTRVADATDMRVLHALAGEPWVRERAQGKPALIRLWDVCGIPDYRQLGTDAHVALVSRLYRYLSEGRGTVPESWVQAEIDALDNVAGNIDTLSYRIAATRTWAFVANRTGWIENQPEWAERTRALENRLSDALHGALVRKFIHRRTSVLLDRNRNRALHTAVDEDGTVHVDGETIGRLEGFTFRSDSATNTRERQLLNAAGKRGLRPILSGRARRLAGTEDARFALDTAGDERVGLSCDGHRIATLLPGGDPLLPRVTLQRELAELPEEAIVRERLEAWLKEAVRHNLRPLFSAVARQETFSPAARGIIVQLVSASAVLRRSAVASLIADLTPEDRQRFRRLGIFFGSRFVHIPALLKPEATRWRMALHAVATDSDMPTLPPPGQASLKDAGGLSRARLERIGYWQVGAFAVRIDIAERIANDLHKQRKAGKAEGFVPDPALATIGGLTSEDFATLVQAFHFRKRKGETGTYVYDHRRRQKEKMTRDRARPADQNNPFAQLGELLGHGPA